MRWERCAEYGIERGRELVGMALALSWSVPACQTDQAIFSLATSPRLAAPRSLVFRSPFATEGRHVTRNMPPAENTERGLSDRRRAVWSKRLRSKTTSDVPSTRTDSIQAPKHIEAKAQFCMIDRLMLILGRPPNLILQEAEARKGANARRAGKQASCGTCSTMRFKEWSWSDRRFYSVARWQPR
ncbi:hypothetical protein BDZ90DRAFT_106977 [Jaminaea rosea]|uniref:Uncharacterized protein n=1 Tax=Jaminaea rosea TaxID=1569628 RepID=A0A316UVW5_9BASI|nr:hypothetical protein BDZ90DRAFT_106977 [Jaminaea rosea]PWN29372.1 hypothetical protein BDZ90DRAFT_106977 [Jaminaea rosea]